MFHTCVITDGTAIFTRQDYPGSESVKIISHSPQLELAPSVDTFRQSFLSLGGQYQEIIVILSSASLSPSVNFARQAVAGTRSLLNIQVIDSQTTAVGLGLMVQAAAEDVQHGLPAHEVCNHLRGMLRNIFAIFCLPDLTYLYQTGQIDLSQAIIGDLLGVIPIFVLDNGQLIHIQKIRSPRHLVDIFYEFVMEFDHLKFLALLKGEPLYEQEIHNLRERINQNLRTPHLNEFSLNPALASLLGPRAIGVISVQRTYEEIS